MTKSIASLASLLLSATAFATGCATDNPPSDDELIDQAELEADTKADGSGCSAAAYNAALVHYKTAVAWSQERERAGVCESENGYMWGIADEASQAVMACSGFRNVIKNSRWAAPVRRVLAPSLTLASLTGELAVVKPSSAANWTGVDQLFARGLRFWAPAFGAHGSPVNVEFKSSNTAVWEGLVYDDKTGNLDWVTMPATYSIAAPSGQAKHRAITLVYGAKTVTYTLDVRSGDSDTAAPVFTLTPDTDELPSLESLVGECEA